MVPVNTLPTTLAKDDVLVLLGAGASVEAGVPHSAAMVEEIEKLLGAEWKEFRELYNFVKSAILYVDGIQGTFGVNVLYNIERLVACLDELARREEHPLYPFVGAWNPRLVQVAGDQFGRVPEFKARIVERLRHRWIEINDYREANYFRGLMRFQRQLNFALHVFTLNYDLCVERVYHAEYGSYPERGFDKARRWNPALLDETAQTDASIFLHKLHGSIDWKASADGTLTYSDSTATISAEEGRMIFGTTYKLQYVDPFLFLVYQLRRRSLEARLIVTIGYGFGDEHINGILAQALRTTKAKRLCALIWCDPRLSQAAMDDKVAELRRQIERQLQLQVGADQLVVIMGGAKDFLDHRFTLESMANLFPKEEELFEVASVAKASI